MTFIIGAVAQGVAHQVGDRLVVVDRGKQLSVHDPLSNKQIIVVAPDALVAIGYSGLAYLKGRSTDDILAEAVAGRPLGKGIQTGGSPIPSIYDIAKRIEERLNDEVTSNAPYGVDVAIIGLKRGKRGRIEPLLWGLEKKPGAEVEIQHEERTPFDWRKSFSVQYFGDFDQTEIDRTRHDMKDLKEQGEERRDAISRLLVETIRRTSAKKPATVGADCMVVRLWREGTKFIADVEYQPVTRVDVTVERTGRPFSFPAAYSPWFISPGFAFSAAMVKGGGWTIGDVEFRIRVPDTTADGGPTAFFGSQDRQPPPV